MAFLFCRGFFVLPWLFCFAVAFLFRRSFFVLLWLLWFAVTFLFCCGFFVLPWLFCFAVAFLFCRSFLVLPWHLWATVRSSHLLVLLKTRCFEKQLQKFWNNNQKCRISSRKDLFLEFIFTEVQEPQRITFNNRNLRALLIDCFRKYCFTNFEPSKKTSEYFILIFCHLKLYF